MAASSLLDYLAQSLTRFPGQQHLSLQVVRSQPRRSHALFPHATNHKTKVWQEEVLVVLSQQIQVPASAPISDSAWASPPQPPLAADSTLDPTDTGEGGPPPLTDDTRSVLTPGLDSLSSSGPVETRRASIPIVAIEANIYTIPSTSTSLIYIAKVDTTGLSTTSISPTRTLVQSFIQYHLTHPPHATDRVRIHIFASAQPQYLFPGSVENTTKHVLDDKGLLRWWKATINGAVTAPSVVETVSPIKPAPQLFYAAAGLNYLESLPYIPLPPPGAPNPTWTYGHPYSTLPSPLHPSSTPASASPLPDHIPSFPDDPKSRFLMSLTSSTIAPSGNEGDYDDVMLGLASAAFTTGHASAARAAEVEHVRERERARLVGGVQGGVDEWWELMQHRQECRSGVLVGFFAVAREGVVDEAAVKKEAPRRYPASLPHRVFTSLWSQFHNVDYARPALAKCAVAADKWREDVRRVVAIEAANAAVATKPSSQPAVPQAEAADVRAVTEAGADEKEAASNDAAEAAADAQRRAIELYEAEVFRELVLNNPAFVREKREAPDEPVKVNMLAPRKKQKRVQPA